MSNPYRRTLGVNVLDVDRMIRYDQLDGQIYKSPKTIVREEHRRRELEQEMKYQIIAEEMKSFARGIDPDALKTKIESLKATIQQLKESNSFQKKILDKKETEEDRFYNRENEVLRKRMVALEEVIKDSPSSLNFNRLKSNLETSQLNESYLKKANSVLKEQADKLSQRVSNLQHELNTLKQSLSKSRELLGSKSSQIQDLKTAMLKDIETLKNKHEEEIDRIKSQKVYIESEFVPSSVGKERGWFTMLCNILMLKKEYDYT